MFKRTLCILSCAAAMTTAMVGCAPLVVGGVAVATGATVSTINDRRSAGAIVNDGVIEKRLSYEITQALKEQLGDEPEGRITVTAYNGKVLLTGEIETLKAKRIVTETVQKSLDVRSVVNELAVQPTISWTQRMSDSKLATTVRSRMVMEDNVYLRHCLHHGYRDAAGKYDCNECGGSNERCRACHFSMRSDVCRAHHGAAQEYQSRK